MTIREYLDNPSGKGAAVNSKVIYEVFLEKFKKYEEMKRDVIIKAFKYKKKYYIYAKLESQSVDKCYYQCVIELTPNDKDTSANLEKTADMKVYVNSPSFNFTFAHVFLREKLIIESFKAKYSREVKHTAPKTRNPYSVVGYEKILVFTLLTAIRKGMLNKDKYKDDKNFMVDMYKNLRKPDEVLKEYELLKRKQAEAKRKEKEKQKEDLKKTSPTTQGSTVTRSSNHNKGKVTPIGANKSKIVKPKRKR